MLTPALMKLHRKNPSAVRTRHNWRDGKIMFNWNLLTAIRKQVKKLK
jgi:hypothetical protein